MLTAMDDPKTWADVERDFDHRWVEEVMMYLARLPTDEGLLCGFVPTDDLLYRLLAELKAHPQ